MQKNTPRAPDRTRQTRQKATPNVEKGDAKHGKTRQPSMPKESLSAGEAARELGISLRTIQRFCSDGGLPCFYTPGGQIRITRTALEAYRTGSESARAGRSTSTSAIQNKRETLETLNVELQERRLKRQLKQLDDEDAEAESERAASIEAEQLRHRATLEESRLQREAREDEREQHRQQQQAERQRREWVDSWIQWALRSLPLGVPSERTLRIPQAVEEALSNIEPTRPRAIIESLVTAAVEGLLAPWRRQQEIEKAIKDARKELPIGMQTLSDFFPPNEWEAKAMSAARDAIGELSPDASLEEIRSAAMHAGAQAAREYEAQQARIRAEQERQQAQIRAEQERQRRASNKAFLVSRGVAEVEPYLARLHLDDDIFDEDLARKSELEVAVRRALEERLTGAELLTDAVRIAREVVDAEV